MQHLMIDLETMGIGPNAAIIAIGAVIFEPGKQDLVCYHEIINLESSMMKGGTITPSTVIWWLKQSDEARAIFHKPSGSITAVLGDFSRWINIHAPDLCAVWGNGANFDNVILRSAYDRAGLDVPWKYNMDRCYRTLRALVPEVRVQDHGVKHNALDDAMHQVKVLLEIFDRLGLYKAE